MRLRYWTITIVACTMVPTVTYAQESQSGPDGMRSTQSGVFTGDQATAGREVYAGRCRSCHTPAAHAGTFKTAFAGQSLAEAFQYIGENMPKDAPGSLTERDTILVLAYFLQLLGEPVGQRPLSADPDSLSAIRIDTLMTQPAHASEEKKS